MTAKMIVLPEITRYIWLRFSATRLLLMPLMLAMGLFFIALSGDNLPNDLLWPAMWAYIIIVIAWGCLDLARAFAQEISNKSWDFIRMSPVNAWQILLGKMFGATSYALYFGVALLGVMAWAYSHATIPTKYDTIYTPDALTVVGAVGGALMATFFGYAITLYMSLLNLRQRQVTATTASGLLGIFASLFALGMVFRSYTLPGSLVSSVWDDIHRPWWGMDIEALHVAWFSLLFATFWLLVGAYRLLRAELQFRAAPVMWAMFCITVTLYHAGFWPQNPVLIGLLATFLIAGLGYVALFYDAPQVDRYRRFARAVAMRSPYDAWKEAPLWSVSLIIFIAAVICGVVVSAAHEKNFDVLDMLALWVSLLLLIVRDGIVIHIVSIGRTVLKGRKFILICYYVLMYFIFPSLIVISAARGTIANEWWNITENSSVYMTPFMPTDAEKLWISILVIGLQIIVATYFLRKIMMRRNS